jgi:hypothetical protein
MTGALIRRLPASVLNISSRGCLIETATPLVPGTVGLLEVGDETHGEAVRICRSVERPGAAMPFRAGTEFLVLDAGAPPSMRVRALWLGSGLGLVGGGENSGCERTSPKAPLPAQVSDTSEESSNSVET